MAIADTITSMQTHTTNAYNMLSNGTDLTGINKNLENLSNTIFEAFLEALRNPNTLFTNLPKTSGSGSQITLNGTAYAPMRINPNPTAISQTTYTGNQLFNASAITRSGFEISNNGQTIKIPLATSGNGYYATYQALKDLCPTLQVGDIVYLYADTNYNTINKYIQLTGTGSGLWNFGTSKTITQNDLDGGVAFYGNRYGDGETTQQVILTNFRITKIANASWEPYVGGTASPNPSYPQDIHTISGNNSVVVDNGNGLSQTNPINLGVKNLLNYANITGVSNATRNDNTIIVTANNEGRNAMIFFSNIPVKSGETIYFSADIKLNSGSSGVYNIINDGVTANANKILNPTLSTTYQRYQTSLTYSSDTNITKLLLQFFSVVGTIEIRNIQISRQSSPSYTPFGTTPLELGTIGNYSNEFVRSGGEQLFDKDNANVLNSYINEVNATIISSGKSKTIYISCNQNTTYTISKTLASARFVVGTTTNTPADNVVCNQVIANNTATSITITTGANDNYLCAFIYHSDNDSPLTLEQVLNRIMINKGTTALPYVPYEKGWYYKQGIGKYVFDKDTTFAENWNSHSEYTTYCMYKYINSNVNTNTTAICNILPYNNNVYGKDEIGIYQETNGGGRFIFRVPKTIATSTQEFQTWLQNNGDMITYAPLATPTYTKITGELAEQLEQVYKGMLSYDGVTNISQINNDLSFNLGASAITK